MDVLMKPKKKEPVKCDCLNVCGDDPWLKDGRATPCARFSSDRKESQQNLQETIKKLRARIKVLGKALMESERDYEQLKRKKK
jgi:hypothetical protein